ncbi:MAG: LON peptidase substrate-binding domain-containing protein [Isosphaeraceae bacterium]|nr:LON peptidase substrate-binding domain-containing protein [Isosphaeraceae bacterium]
MDDFDLSDFDGVCRLFPLPELVQFPHSVLPLHVFEPRYRQMTEDALATDKLLTIVQLRPQGELNELGIRAIEKSACLGRIIRHERLPDGRFRLLLHGLCRVRLLEEIPSAKLYRIARAILMPDRDLESPSIDPSVLSVACRAFLVKTRGRIEPELEAMLSSPLPLGILADIVSQAMPLPAEAKQMLLDEDDPAMRARMLLEWIARVVPPAVAGGPRSDFPPPFSMN